VGGGEWVVGGSHWSSFPRRLDPTTCYPGVGACPRRPPVAGASAPLRPGTAAGPAACSGARESGARAGSGWGIPLHGMVIANAARLLRLLNILILFELIIMIIY